MDECRGDERLREFRRLSFEMMSKMTQSQAMEMFSIMEQLLFAVMSEFHQVDRGESNLVAIPFRQQAVLNLIAARTQEAMDGKPCLDSDDLGAILTFVWNVSTEAGEAPLSCLRDMALFIGSWRSFLQHENQRMVRGTEE